MTIFHHPIKVRFQHCDPAGIVFYPRFFDMLNMVVEEWFEAGLDCPLHDLIQKQNCGIPTVTTTIDFFHPSRFGDQLDWNLAVLDLGRTSAKLDFRALNSDQIRLKGSLVIVFFNLQTNRPTPWPHDLRQKIASYRIQN